MEDRRFCRITLTEHETDAVLELFPSGAQTEDRDFGYGVTLGGLAEIFRKAKNTGDLVVWFSEIEATATLGYIKGRLPVDEQGVFALPDAEARSIAATYDKIRDSLNDAIRETSGPLGRARWWLMKRFMGGVRTK